MLRGGEGREADKPERTGERTGDVEIEGLAGAGVSAAIGLGMLKPRALGLGRLAQVVSEGKEGKLTGKCCSWR